MNFQINKILGLSCLILSMNVFAEDHHAESKTFSKTQVSDNIWMLQGKGGNIAVLNGDDGLLMIDDDYKVMTEALKGEIKSLGGLDKLTYLINTHWHGDHTEGNLELGNHASIVAHDNVRTRLMTRQEVKIFNMVKEPYPEKALPSITYQKEMTLHFNNEEIGLRHYAGGHTDGDSVVFFKKANVVHMGDHFFSGFFPFVDTGTGGNVLQMAENVKAILELVDDQTKIIPGHGPLSTKQDMQQFYDMLIGTSGEVKQMKKAGLTLDQIKAKGLSEKWNDWTDGFLSTEVWVGIIYSSL